MILKELSFYENQEKKDESQQFVEIDGDNSIKPVHKDLKLKLQIVKNINLLMQKLVISKEKIFDTLDRFTPLLIIILMIFITLIV